MITKQEAEGWGWVVIMTVLAMGLLGWDTPDKGFIAGIIFGLQLTAGLTLALFLVWFIASMFKQPSS